MEGGLEDAQAAIPALAAPHITCRNGRSGVRSFTNAARTTFCRPVEAVARAK